MAVEEKRGCGYRQVGGMYLVGGYISEPCDRLPYPLPICPVCGNGIKVGRGFTRINPLRLFGKHYPDSLADAALGGGWCTDDRPCMVCDPPDEPAFIMGVGERYYPTPGHFIQEGIRLGISKRIAQIPVDFKVGKTIIYLAHPKACKIVVQDGTDDTRLVDATEYEYTKGIFCAFRPVKIEKLYWQSDLDNMSEKEKNSLERRGITPVGIPNGELDHA